MKKTETKNSNNTHIVLGVIFAIIFLSPLFIHLNPPLKLANFYIELPKVYSGDEPHYLIIVNSLVEDHDFDLWNNYEAVRLNRTDDMGARFLGWEGDHHTVFVKGSSFVRWREIFTSSLNRVPGKEEFDLTGYSEYTFHPIGLPLLSSLLLFQFAHSEYLEPAAIILTCLVALTGMYFLFLLLLFYSKRRMLSILITGLFAFSTPLWHYSRSAFTEAYTSSLLIISLYCILVKKRYALAGFLMGLAFFMKYPMALLAGVLVAYLTLKRQYKGAVEFCIPFGSFSIIQLSANSILFGSMFQFSIPAGFHFEIFKQFWHVLFSEVHGLFAFAPFLIFSVIGFYYLIKEDWQLGVLCLTLVIIFLLFFTVAFGRDEYSYASREVLPIILLFSLPFIFWLKQKKQIKVLIATFFIFITASIVINFFSVLGHDHVFARPVGDILRLFLTF